MTKSRQLPLSRMRNISGSGVFVKHFAQYGYTAMKPYAHRDDYYIVVLLTEGSAAVEIDFQRLELTAGDILIVSPWQVHKKPADEDWRADGWMLAFSPELLTEAEARAIEEYSISPRPLTPADGVATDIVTLCSMIEGNTGNDSVRNALACAVKAMALSAIDKTDRDTPPRYAAITSRLRMLLESHLAQEKSPAAYASMLNITEVYLNEAVKGATGLSAGAYIRGRITVQAKRMLAHTSLSAKEIAYALGYDDYVYFSKLFKKCAGVSPSAYRKNLK